MPAECPGHECRANSQSRSPPEDGRHHKFAVATRPQLRGRENTRKAQLWTAVMHGVFADCKTGSAIIDNQALFDIHLL